MYAVLREIRFNYGHRLLDYSGKCAHLHGHGARVEIEISSDKLDGKGMVMDFYEIKETIGQWIDRELDHKMILCERDPLLPELKKAGEPVVVIKENPTAEVLARWIYEEARRRKLPVRKVTLWETEHNAAVYSE
ncbi:MAG: 6-carboxytetrahydropterin synthase [Candidatus Omnitrophota bacterium]|jgi:6-pyruvoyltetrahydropterin/6-carboxytetrahydropterin synthase